MPTHPKSGECMSRKFAQGIVDKHSLCPSSPKQNVAPPPCRVDNIFGCSSGLLSMKPGLYDSICLIREDSSSHWDPATSSASWLELGRPFGAATNQSGNSEEVRMPLGLECWEAQRRLFSSVAFLRSASARIGGSCSPPCPCIDLKH